MESVIKTLDVTLLPCPFCGEPAELNLQST